MDAKLTEKLYKEFPLLYAESKLDMSRTCMCWGFSHDNGWYDLIYELSAKLEPMIEELMHKVPVEEKICFCGCRYFDHEISIKHKPCKIVHKIPYYPFKKTWFIVNNDASKALVIWNRIAQKFKTWVNDFCDFISPVIYKRVPCHCKGYEEYHATAVQVKEKFGYLHFYASGFTDEMDELVTEAENKSATICETCSKPGKLRNDLPWKRTLCNDCYTEHITPKEDE